MKEDKTKKADEVLAIWPQLYRALTIAIPNNLSVSLMFDAEDEGGGEAAKRNCEYIVSVLRGIFDNFKLCGDINLSIHKPDTYKKPKKAYTAEDLLRECERVKSNPLPFEGLCHVSEALLGTAVRKLSFSLEQVNAVKHIACCIARVDGTEIKAEHTAEAINYVNTHEHLTYFDPDKYEHFGHHIRISASHEISEADIKRAIEYLQILVALK